MTSLHVIYGLALPPNSKSWLHLCTKPCAICIPNIGRCILVLLMHVHERLLITLQICKVAKYMLHYFQSKISLVWKYGINYGRFLVWNGVEENCQNGIWKNCLPFHTIPCRQHKSNKIADKVNLPVFFLH